MNRYERYLYEKQQEPVASLFSYFEAFNRADPSEDEVNEYYGKLAEAHNFRYKTRKENAGHAYRTRELWDRYNAIYESEYKDGISHKLQSMRCHIASHRKDMIYDRLCAPDHGEICIHAGCFWCEAQGEEVEFEKKCQKGRRDRAKKEEAEKIRIKNLN